MRARARQSGPANLRRLGGRDSAPPDSHVQLEYSGATIAALTNLKRDPHALAMSLRDAREIGLPRMFRPISKRGSSGRARPSVAPLLSTILTSISSSSLPGRKVSTPSLHGSARATGRWPPSAEPDALLPYASRPMTPCESLTTLRQPLAGARKPIWKLTPVLVAGPHCAALCLMPRPSASSPSSSSTSLYRPPTRPPVCNTSQRRPPAPPLAPPPSPPCGNPLRWTGACAPRPPSRPPSPTYCAN